jgi:hypothetical protein
MLMFLTAGNRNTLEGKVLIYAELYDNSVDPPLNPLYLGLSASVERSDIEKLNLPKRSQDSIRYNDITIISEDPLNFYAADFYTAEFQTSDFGLISRQNWKTLFAGASWEKSLTDNKIILCFKGYVRHYDKHLKRLLPPEENSYKNYAGVFLKKALVDHYVRPLMYAVKINNQNLKDAICQRFVNFFEQNFHNEVEPLLDVILNMSLETDKRKKLVKYNLHKLVSVCNEDYERALYLSKKIADLTST